MAAMPIAKTSRTAPTYTLDNAWQHARRRLRMLEQCYDEATTRRLRALGVSPGWRCLEVGAGGGSIASWLCRRVGAAGPVLATDLDTRFPGAIEAPGLEVRRHDITTDALPDRAFDLVHARAVLEHLPLPARARALVRGASPECLVWRMVWTTLRERILEAGVLSAPELDGLIALHDDPGFAWMGPIVMAAWGRRPRQE